MYNQRFYSTPLGYKSKLNEYAQKNKQNSPIYETYRVGGNDHTPIWETKVSFLNLECKSKYCDSKKDAENDGAKIMYELIEASNIIDNKINIDNLLEHDKIDKKIDLSTLCNYEKIMLIDIENVEFTLDPIKYSNTIFIIFLSKNSSKRIKATMLDKYDNCIIMISNSVVKDSADHYLTFTAGQLSIILKDITIDYYVFTKDHYGSCLEEFIPRMKFICSLEDFK